MYLKICPYLLEKIYSTLKNKKWYDNHILAIIVLDKILKNESEKSG